MNNYSYDEFVKNDDKTLRELLNIQGVYSDIYFVSLFSEKRTPDENRILSCIARQFSNDLLTLEDILSMRFSAVLRVRNMGKSGQIILLNSILKFFKLGELQLESKEINSNKLKSILEGKSIQELNDLINGIFNDLSENQQKKFLSKVMGSCRKN